MFGKPKRNPLNTNSVLPFGKYKGSTVGQIINTDFTYLIWMQDNTDIEFSVDVQDELYNLEIGVGTNPFTDVIEDEYEHYGIEYEDTF